MNLQTLVYRRSDSRSRHDLPELQCKNGSAFVSGRLQFSGGVAIITRCREPGKAMIGIKWRISIEPNSPTKLSTLGEVLPFGEEIFSTWLGPG
jgi:hypothetical protein